MKLGKYALSIFSLLVSLLALAIYFTQRNDKMQQSDYLIAGAFGLLLLLCIGIFYKTKPRWAPYVEEYALLTDWPPEADALASFTTMFFLFLALLFGFLFPFGLYLHQPMTSREIFMAFILSCLIWVGRRDHLLETGKSRWRCLPFLSLAGLLWAVCVAPVPNPTATTLLLLATFCVETALSIGMQVYRCHR